MKIISFIRDQVGLRTIEVEISVTKGLPKIQFLGLPDPLIKESVLRIQSAFKHSNFELPKTKQIIVNLKPNYLKKSSRGIDLAVAAGILWETEQIEKPEEGVVAIYGELNLKGDVFVPDDFDDLDEIPKVSRFYTGPVNKAQNFNLYSVSKLQDLALPTFIEKNDSATEIKRPPVLNIDVTPAQAELIELAAVGEHHTLLSGPPGTGKTTMALAISSLLKDPPIVDLRKYQKISRHFGIPIEWRPIVTPHHTSTALAMIGGGGSPRPGEITRSHGGALIMDEFLEFDSKVQEALREPLETGKITISRTGSVVIYPAKFLLLATTNLCPCGYFIPEKNFECRGRPRSCSNYIQKLSGPMMDRFEVLALSHEWKSLEKIKLKSLKSKIEDVHDFIKKERLQVCMNNDLKADEITNFVPKFILENLIPQTGNSYRRYLALLKVARTFADMDYSVEIKEAHLEKAFIYTNANSNKIKTYALNWNY